MDQTNKNEVFCGGVRVTNGDILVGDGDGVVVIESNKLDELIDTAFEIEKKETQALNRVFLGCNSHQQFTNHGMEQIGFGKDTVKMYFRHGVTEVMKILVGWSCRSQSGYRLQSTI